MTALGIFAKPPVPGLVKTRLMADIGADKAAQVYRYCLEHSLDAASNSGLEYRLFLSEDSDDDCFADQSYSLQRGADLGARMQNALNSLLAENEYGAMIIGSDCLELGPRQLQAAARALNDHELVLQPAFDGGYALIACKRVEPALFSGIRWSSDEVLAQTLQRADALGLRVCLLETVRDIDRLQDLEHYPQLLALIASS